MISKGEDSFLLNTNKNDYGNSIFFVYWQLNKNTYLTI